MSALPQKRTFVHAIRMSALGLGRFKTFRQKRFNLRETVSEPFFEFGYARMAAIKGWMPMMFITRVRL